MRPAFDELQDGSIGPATVTLLIALIRQVGRMNSFPPPFGFQRWTTEAAQSYLGALFSTKNGAGFVVQCAVKAHSQQSLERLLLAAIKNALIDEAKATPVGQLRRRMEGLLAKDDRFLNARGLLGQSGWTLPENGSTVWSEDFEELQRLTASVSVEPIGRLNRGGPTPPGPRRSLLTLSFEALRRAAGAVRTQMLSRLLVDRFGLDAAPEQDPAVTGEPSALMNDPETVALARRFFDELSGEERALLRDPAAVAAAVHHDPQAAALVLRLRAWAGSEIGADAVGVLLTWCAPAASKSGRQ